MEPYKSPQRAYQRDGGYHLYQVKGGRTEGLFSARYHDRYVLPEGSPGDDARKARQCPRRPGEQGRKPALSNEVQSRHTILPARAPSRKRAKPSQATATRRMISSTSSMDPKRAGRGTAPIRKVIAAARG